MVSCAGINRSTDQLNDQACQTPSKNGPQNRNELLPRRRIDHFDIPNSGKGDAIRSLDGMLGEVEARLDQDALLIDAVRRGRNVVLPLYFDREPTAGGNAADPSGMLVVNSLNAAVLPAGETGIYPKLATAAGLAPSGPLSGRGVWEPFDALAGKAGALGHMRLDEDEDGRVRRLPLLIEFRGRLVPALALQLAIKRGNSRLKHLSVEADLFGQPTLRVAGLRLTTDGAYRMLLNVDRAWTRQRLFSCSELFNGEIDPTVLKDQIVLIGITAEPLARWHRVGQHDRAADVAVMANALAGILDDNRLTQPSWAHMLAVAAVLYFGLILVVVVPRVSVRAGAGILLFFLVVWYAAAVGLLLAYGYRIDVLGPAALAGAGFLLVQFTLASRRLQMDRMDACKTLGLSYQGLGMLDMAHEKFLQCPVRDRTVKNLLYNLALDFERKRMFNKALDVYRHIRSAGAFKDVDKRIRRFTDLDNTLVAGPRGENSLMLTGDGAKPTFGRYEILQELGRGGMGTVYLGRDPKINREVAIKTLEYAEVEPAELPEVKTRFFREAEAAGKLSHPNIVSVYDVGEEHDMAYIAMELLKGDNLTWVCVKGHLLPVRRVLEIVGDVTAALDYAHCQGVIHRDIKPANIMLLEGGRVKVTDFSIAHVVDASQTRTGVILGTPNYMSPEQVSGKRLDGRSDLFSLGIVLYEMLSGTRPFKGDSMSAMLYAITKTPHRPLNQVAEGIPACVAELADKLLAKPKSRRFDSAASAAKAIDDCINRL